MAVFSTQPKLCLIEWNKWVLKPKLMSPWAESKGIMKAYFVYILECKNGYLYTGVTNNIERRLIEHNEGLNKDCYTYKRRPVQLLYQQKFT